jgi:hypothetical protein
MDENPVDYLLGGRTRRCDLKALNLSFSKQITFLNPGSFVLQGLIYF